MPLLRKIEDVFVQLVRIVLLAFSVLVLVAMASYLWDKTIGKKEDGTSSSVSWADLKPDMKYVVEETGRDMGMSTPDMALQDSLTNPQLRPAFKQADALVRSFVALKPEHHAEIEKNNESKGLADLNPLLVGDSIPSKEQIEAYVKEQEAKAKAEEERLERLLGISDSEEAAVEAGTEAAVAAAEAAACCSSDEAYWTEPVDVAKVLHERASQVRSEYDAKAYETFVLGAPKAIELVLSDAKLAPKLHDQTISRLVDMVLTNYSISFSRAVSEQDDSESLWDRFFNSLELTLWSLIMSFLVMVVFVVMTIRMERHLRRISEQGKSS
ncbi:MAG TPA: hypothetical protein VIG85_01450 [Comamonas sp.]